MAYNLVNEENVYTCTGKPQPRDIEQILHWMLNEGFRTSFESLRNKTFIYQKNLNISHYIKKMYPNYKN